MYYTVLLGTKPSLGWVTAVFAQPLVTLVLHWFKWSSQQAIKAAEGTKELLKSQFAEMKAIQLALRLLKEKSGQYSVSLRTHGWWQTSCGGDYCNSNRSTGSTELNPSELLNCSKTLLLRWKTLL